MRKQEIAHELVKRTGLTSSQAIHAVDAFIDIIADAVINDEPIMLRGFGTIKTVKRAAKVARNINTGTTMLLPPRRQVKFIAYNQLQENINRHDESL